ncbi:hypothetical protein [Flagellimonas profundi]|uniref:DUF3828 domain-containing protein n=1 Tax=Flagellimonas profundi TaxID=2915620 RepID=A0ABS3FHW6_9FLAO|nr:hypothetical protein [Allomuricauda profundi]MBO0342131.1 hypothetical protein [Allomuricauda profundi]
MRLIFSLIAIIFLCCKAPKSNKTIANEEYEIVNKVLNTVRSKQFILYDEIYNYNVDFAIVGVYKGWYNKHLTGKITPMASEDIEWILNQDDIEYISNKIKSDTIKTRWDRKQIKNPNLIYASDRPDLVESTDLPRPPRVELSKPYLNENRTKAIIIRIIGGNGYLMLAKKVGDDWELCGEIEYMFS